MRFDSGQEHRYLPPLPPSFSFWSKDSGLQEIPYEIRSNGVPLATELWGQASVWWRDLNSDSSIRLHWKILNCQTDSFTLIPAFGIISHSRDSTHITVGLERDPLSLVSTIEEVLGKKSSGSGPEKGNTAVGIRHAATSHRVSSKLHWLRRQTVVARSVWFARGLRPQRLLFFCFLLRFRS
jgi:hypothetical protein